MTTFNLGNVNFYGETSYEDIILDNVISFMEYGLLQIGAYYNIQLDQQDHQGNNESILKPVRWPGVSDYKIYGGKKHKWVWESNIDLKFSGGAQPIVPSGIDVNGTFYPTGTLVEGTGYYIDFSRGRVVFENPLPSSYVVKCPHSLRWVNVYEDDSYEYRSLISDWINKIQSSGMELRIGENIYLPAITIGIKEYSTNRGVGLGSRAKNCTAEIEFNIISSTPHERKKLSDICYMLETKSLHLFDPNASGIKPLNHRGELINPSFDWKYLTQNVKLNNSLCRFEENFKVMKIKNDVLPIYRGRVIAGLELNIVPI